MFTEPLNPPANASYLVGRLQIDEYNCGDIAYKGWDFIINQMTNPGPAPK